MIDPRLVAEARKLLDKARFISESPAGRPGPVGHGHPSSRPPPGAFTYQRSTLAQCGARINAAIARDSEEELRTAVKWALDELDRIQHSRGHSPETPAQRARRIVDDYEGVAAPDVARAEKLSITTVRNARIAHGRDARLGKRLAKA